MNLDDAIAENTLGYETLQGEYPNIKELQKKISRRIQASPSKIESLVQDGEAFNDALEEQDVADFMAKLAKSS